MRRLAVLLPAFLLVSSQFSPAAAATLTGVVRDPDGRPVPGARVIVTGARPGTAEGITDAAGRFEIAALRDGRHEVRVVLDGFSAPPAVVELRDGADRAVTVDLRVSALSEALVVSAAHVDLPLSQAAASVTVVGRPEIESRQLRTLADTLRHVPGLSVAQNGLGLTSLFTRGGDSDFTLVLIDGMRANAFGGGADLSQLPLVDVERVEIVRGPQSAVFGSDAIGGVVQIVTKRCAGTSGAGGCERVDASLEGGSLGSARARAAAGGAPGAWSWNAYGEHAQTDGFTGTAPATGETVSNDDGRVQHAGIGLAWRSAGGADVRGIARLSATRRGFPGAYGSNPVGAFTRVDRISRGENNHRQAGLQWTQPWGGAASRVRQRTDAAFTDLDGNFASPFGLSESETRRLTVRTQADAALAPAFGASAGVEVLREQAGSTFITGASFAPLPVKRLVAGYFGEARYAPHARVSTAAGVRVEQIRRDALPGDPNAFVPRPAFAADHVTSVNPRLAAAVLVAGGDVAARSTRLRASAGTGIRPPDAFEIAFTDNPGLKPERSRSVDAGVQQTFASGALVLEATAFFNEYDDLIVAVGRSFRDASRYRTDNISNARSRGVELAAGARPTAAVDVRASYTWLDTEILAVDRGSDAPAPYRVGEHLIRRPRHQGSLTAIYAAARWTAFATATFRGRVRDVEPTLGASGGVFDAAGFTVFNAGASVRIMRALDLFARVENAADRAHEEAFGFPAPGRLVMAGVRVAAGR